MYKLLFDSDALIKISKADFADAVVKNFEVIITEEVYEETVKEGKKGFYPDADKIEKLVQDNKIRIIKTHYKSKKKLKQIFGKGETSIYKARRKYDLIVTDDLSFTLYMQKENIKTLSSAHLILILAKKNKIKKDEAYICLEKLSPFIRKEIYKLVKEDIKGE